MEEFCTPRMVRTYMSFTAPSRVPDVHENDLALLSVGSVKGTASNIRVLLSDPLW